MSVHISCLAEACERLRIPCKPIGDDGNFLRVDLDRTYYFPGSAAPFNDDAIAKICRDKEFTFKLLQGILTVPKTLGFVDPQGPELYRKYARAKSYDEIVTSICAAFTFPVIVKRNSGSQGKNVFLCHDREEALQAVTAVFDKEPSGYDHVILAQEYIPSRTEYRVVVFRRQLLLAYRKDNSGATFVGNLSPLHWEEAKAVLVTDQALLSALEEFIAPLYERLDLEYGGLDIVEDGSGAFRLIEINCRPGFSYFVRDNGREPLIGMYEKILRALSAAR